MKQMTIAIALLTALFACNSTTQTKEEKTNPLDSLNASIEQILQGKKADVGVAILGPDGQQQISINGDKAYTIMSVVKFPQALYILHLVEKGTLKLDQPVNFTAAELNRDTHSPLRDGSNGKPVTVPLSKVIEYAVSVSDNIACDKLFDLGGGPAAMNKYFEEMKVKDFHTASDYKHIKMDSLFVNNATPNAMLELLKRFNDGDFVNDSSHAFLWNIMINSPSGPNRLRGRLPETAVVAHKTGTFFSDSTNILAINDAGIVQMPDKRKFIIVVFVNNSKETPETNYRIIADISKTCWDFYQKN